MGPGVLKISLNKCANIFSLKFVASFQKDFGTSSSLFLRKQKLLVLITVNIDGVITV